jgi:hypothetical protein
LLSVDDFSSRHLSFNEDSIKAILSVRTSLNTHCKRVCEPVQTRPT